MEGPDVEGHFLEQALRHHVMRMVMGVHEARHDELARGIDDFDAGVSRQVWPDPLDPLAADQDIGLSRLMDVAIMVVDATAADQNARDLSGAGHFIFLLRPYALNPLAA